MVSINLKPTDELIVSATSIAIVYAIFSQGTPNYADVRADTPGNSNTHAAVKMAAVTSVGVVGTLALVAKSPTVFTIGGLMIIFETWKYHFANYGKNGNLQNQNQPG
jgi:hypothetical protein